MSERQFQMHMARVLMADCRTRRRWPASRDFYWHQFAYAQQCRRRAAAMCDTMQRELFA
jgi:hypothetical protein